jgi:hypothetical protein
MKTINERTTQDGGRPVPPPRIFAINSDYQTVVKAHLSYSGLSGLKGPITNEDDIVFKSAECILDGLTANESRRSRMETSSAIDIPSPRKGRGVYLSWVLSSDGMPVMFCVDSEGRSRGKLVLRGTVTQSVAERLLWAKLDAVDPVPVLRLVPDEPKATAATLVASEEHST